MLTALRQNKHWRRREPKRLQNDDPKTTLVVDLPKHQKAAYAQAARWEGKKLAVWVLEHLDHAADDALAEEKASKMMKEMKSD